jgi:hypothetical protein
VLLECQKQNIRDNGSNGKIAFNLEVQCFRLALSNRTNRVGVSHLLHVRIETDPVSETLCNTPLSESTPQRVGGLLWGGGTWIGFQDPPRY